MIRNIDRGIPAPYNPLRKLSCAVIGRAMREASRGNMEAFIWLCSEQDTEYWLDMAGLPRSDLVVWLRAGAHLPQIRANGR